MDAPDSALFRPLIFNQLEIPGRLIKAASAETRATADGHCENHMLEFYEPIAADR